MESNFSGKTSNENHCEDQHQQEEMTSGLDKSLAPLLKLVQPN